MLTHGCCAGQQRSSQFCLLQGTPLFCFFLGVFPRKWVLTRWFLFRGPCFAALGSGAVSRRYAHLMKTTPCVQMPHLWHASVPRKPKKILERTLPEIAIVTDPSHQRETQPYALTQPVMGSFSMCAKSSWTADVPQGSPNHCMIVRFYTSNTTQELHFPKSHPAGVMGAAGAPVDCFVFLSAAIGWRHCGKDAIVSPLSVYREQVLRCWNRTGIV